MFALRPRLTSILAAVCALAPFGCGHKEIVDKKPSAPPVDVSYPVTRTVTDYELYPGRTEAVQRVDFQARVTGYLKDIGFEDGADVKKDQVLFVIDERQYKADVDKATANVEVARARVDKGKKDFDRVVATKKDDAGAVSQKQFDLAYAEKEESKAALDLAVAQQELAKVFLDFCVIKAPFPGKIGASSLKKENLVLQDKTLLTTLVSQKPIFVTFNVDDHTLQKFQEMIKAGKVKNYKDKEYKVELALPGERVFRRTGTVDFVNNELDPTTGTIKVRAKYDNEDMAMIPQKYVRVKVPVGDPYQALLVTDSSLGADQDQKYLWVLNDKDLPEKRPVELGQMHDGLRAILPFREIEQTDEKGNKVTKKIATLGPKDRVVVNGVQRVREGVPVQPTLVDMPVPLVDIPIVKVNPPKAEKK